MSRDRDALVREQMAAWAEGRQTECVVAVGRFPDDPADFCHVCENTGIIRCAHCANTGRIQCAIPGCRHECPECDGDGGDPCGACEPPDAEVAGRTQLEHAAAAALQEEEES